MGCQTVPVINMEMNFSIEMMHVKDAQYLNNMEDAEQYSAASCNKGPGIYMYHWSTSVAVESTNAANRKMHSKSSVDPMNACILLMKLECKRFNVQRAEAWSSDNFLTPHGTVEYKEVFQDINYLNFNNTIVILDNSYKCTACCNMTPSKNPVRKVVIFRSQ